MTTRRKTAGRNNQAQLTAEETKIAAEAMMNATVAHQRAADWCMAKPDAKPPNTDAVYFTVASFELFLLSVEQSLRLLLLLQYAVVRHNTNHNVHVLYKAVKNKDGGKGGIRQGIINKMTELSQIGGFDPVSEKELDSCLQKHDSSYSNFRYFGLDNRAKRNKEKWGVLPREVRVVRCLAQALILLNVDEMERRGMGFLQCYGKIPKSEMTEEQKAFMNRVKS